MIDAALVGAVTSGLLPEVATVAAPVGNVRCLVWGHAGDPPVLLVHGNGGLALWWAPLVASLVPGWRVIAPDLRGHGESDWAEPPSYRIEDFGADLDAVCRALAPGGAPVVGHSMGGRVATWFAARHSERVPGVAVLDSRFDPVDASIVERFRGRVAGTRDGRGYPTREAAMAAFRFVPDEADVPEPVVRLLAHHAVRERGPGDWTFRFDRAVLGLDGDGAGDLYAIAAQIRAPMWCAGGAESWVCSSADRARIAAHVPDCTTDEFPGGHHFLLAHGRAVGTALRRFLDRLNLPAARDRR